MTDRHTLPARASAVQMIKFASVGIANTLVDFALFALLFSVFGLDKFLANTIAFLVAVLNSYVLNHRWTFAAKGGAFAIRPALYFIALNAVGLLISNLTIYLLAPPLHPLMAKVIATLATFLWNFTTSKLFVFRTRSGAV